MKITKFKFVYFICDFKIEGNNKIIKNIKNTQIIIKNDLISNSINQKTKLQLSPYFYINEKTA